MPKKPITRKRPVTTRDTSTRARVWMKAFLASLRLKANVTIACEEANVSRATVYRHKGKEAFAAEWEAALAEGIDRLEAEAWRRAVDGVSEPVFQMGVQVGVVQRYSDTLMVLLLKGHKPSKFRERVSTEHSGVLTIDALRNQMQKRVPRIEVAERESESHSELTGIVPA